MSDSKDILKLIEDIRNLKVDLEDVQDDHELAKKRLYEAEEDVSYLEDLIKNFERDIEEKENTLLELI